MSLYLQIYFEVLGVYILLLWAMYLPFRGGQLYNGPFYCMTIGAYTAAYTAKYLDYPAGLALFVALVVGTFIGFLTSFAFSRTSGIVTAAASMSLIFILLAIINNLNFVNATRGIWGIPKMSGLLVTIYIFVLLIGFIVYRIENSRLGRALEAMRTDPDLASTLGMNLPMISVVVMTLSTSIGAIAGAFYAFTLGSILPQNFNFTMVLTTMAILFVGGRYTMWGVLISAPVLWGLQQWVPAEIAKFANLFYGALLVIVLVLRPEGIISREILQKLKVKTRSRLQRNK
jgi:branched-chain amino acid transport system permease protein